MGNPIKNFKQRSATHYDQYFKKYIKETSITKVSLCLHRGIIIVIILKSKSIEI